MAYKPKFGSSKREALWQRECFNAFACGRGNLPVCNICGETVEHAAPWDESHLPWRGAPAHLRTVGVAHRHCNRMHGRKFVVPAFAKADRIAKRDARVRGPGLGNHPMPGGRLSRTRKTIRGRVVPRLSLAEKHAATMAARAILTSVKE